MDPERAQLTAASHALQAAVRAFRTRAAWQRAPDHRAVEARVQRHLDIVRRRVPAGGTSASAAGGCVHVVHWNILHGQQYAAVRRTLLEERALAAADLVSLNEVDLGLARSGNRDVAFELAQELGLHAAWTPLFLELSAGHRTPAAIAARPQGESLFGLALLSRWPLGEVRRIVLQTPAELLFDREGKVGTFVALVATVLRPGASFQCIVTHLDVHGSPATRLAQMRTILAAVPAGPAILAGDLNTTTFARGNSWRALRTLAILALAPRRTLRRRLLAPHLPAGGAREPLFDALRQAGFSIEPFNDATPTLALHFDDFHELDFLPRPLRRAAVKLLRGVERRNVLRLDWIAARGFAADPARPPRALHEFLHGTPPASDHAPIRAGLRAPTG